MQIVIDIPDEDYKRIKDMPDAFNSLTSRAYKSIKNGTSLPEGHGRLIDVDGLKEYINGCEFCNNCPKKEFRCEFACTLPDYLTDDIEMILDAQSTILEAAEEVSE